MNKNGILLYIIMGEEVKARVSTRGFFPALDLLEELDGGVVLLGVLARRGALLCDDWHAGRVQVHRDRHLKLCNHEL